MGGHDCVSAGSTLARSTRAYCRIRLSSLLLIFLVECAWFLSILTRIILIPLPDFSTSYVDRLQSYESQPASPCDTPATSPTASRRVSLDEAPAGEGHIANAPLPLAAPESSSEVNASADESTPLRDADAPAYGSASHPAPRPAAWAHTFPRSKHSGKRRNTVAETSQEIFAGGHHRHEERGSHVEHYGSTKAWRGWFGLGGEGDERQGHEHDEEAASGSAPRKTRRDEGAKPLGNGHARDGHEHGHGHRQHHSGHVHSHGHVHMDMERWSPERASGAEEEELDWPVTKVGMRRQVIGILVSVVCH